MDPYPHTNAPAEPAKAPPPRRERRRRGALRAVAAGASAALIFAACGSTASHSPSAAKKGSPAPSGHQGGTLTIAAIEPPGSLNPILDTLSVPLQWYTEMAYEPLIHMAPSGQLVPGLATSWDYVGANHLQFVFHLRSGARFSDGSPVTAQAVVSYIDAYKKGTGTALLANVGAIQATDPSTVTMTLTSGNPILPYIFSDNNDDAGYIVSPNELNDAAKLASGTYGAGPYVLDTTDTIPNSLYVYTPNPYYYDPSAIHWRKVIIKVIPTENATLAALKTGQVQVAEGDPTVADSAVAAGLHVTKGPYELYQLTVSDPGGKLTPALANPKVRQALAYAIDRPAIEKAIFGAYGTNDQENVAAGAPGSDPALQHYYSYDPAKAKALLAQAGYPNGFTVTALTASVEVDTTQVSEAVASQLAQVGVKLDYTDPPPSQWLPDLFMPKWGLQIIGWPDYIVYFLVKEIFGQYGLTNYFHTATPTITNLLDQGASLDPNSPEFANVEKQMAAALLQEGYAIPIATQDLVIMSSPKVGGIVINGTWPVPNPTDWYPTS